MAQSIQSKEYSVEFGLVNYLQSFQVKAVRSALFFQIISTIPLSFPHPPIPPGSRL